MQQNLPLLGSQIRGAVAAAQHVFPKADAPNYKISNSENDVRCAILGCFTCG